MDVEALRSLLMEIGYQQYNTIEDEERIVSVSGVVYPLFSNIHDVVGVWAVDDVNKTNNLYISHTRTTITTSASAGTRVLVTYVVEEGLNDYAAQRIVDWTAVEVKADLGDFSLDLDNPSTELEKVASVYRELLALANAYLLMNNVNFVQSDANISLFNFQTMSKLWGEGMSTDSLFNRLFQRIEMVRKAAMYLTVDAELIEPGYSPGFWQEEGIITDWLGDLKQTI